MKMAAEVNPSTSESTITVIVSSFDALAISLNNAQPWSILSKHFGSSR